MFPQTDFLFTIRCHPLWGSFPVGNFFLKGRDRPGSKIFDIGRSVVFFFFFYGGITLGKMEERGHLALY